LSADRAGESVPARVREAMKPVLAVLAADPTAPSAVTDVDAAWQVHVLDSLTALRVEGLREAGRIADVGSGAGFPGLPIAAALPDASVDLIESIGRKCEFIRRGIEAAGLANARVVQARAEVWAERPAPGGGRGAYQAVTARAVARLATLAELASPLLVDGGLLVGWKGRRRPDEEAELGRAKDRLAMEPVEILRVEPHPGASHRHLHVLRKRGPTPEGLPRRPGMAKKRPFGRVP
jgi:16S rRNA (guanine527-N7)-methyltransferase